MLSRRDFGGISAAMTLAATAGCASSVGRAGRPDNVTGGFSINDLEHRTFQWFWDTANPANGLIPDRWPSKSFCSIAAVGFGLTAYPIGVERGWITRAQALTRTLTTLRFFGMCEPRCLRLNSSRAPQRR